MTNEALLYICHKRVHAMEIASIGNYRPSEADGKLVRELQLKDLPAPYDVPQEMFVRYTPEPGDFLVIYEDGYQSFSPRKAFLEGYSLALGDNVLMERLDSLSSLEVGERLPDWAQSELENCGASSPHPVSRVAREAYVTINSQKQQIERLRERLEEEIGS